MVCPSDRIQDHGYLESFHTFRTHEQVWLTVNSLGSSFHLNSLHLPHSTDNAQSSHSLSGFTLVTQNSSQPFTLSKVSTTLQNVHF